MSHHNHLQLVILWIWHGVNVSLVALIHLLFGKAFIKPQSLQAWATLGVTLLTGISVAMSIFYQWQKNKKPKNKRK